MRADVDPEDLRALHTPFYLFMGPVVAYTSLRVDDVTSKYKVSRDLYLDVHVPFQQLQRCLGIYFLQEILIIIFLPITRQRFVVD